MTTPIRLSLLLAGTLACAPAPRLPAPSVDPARVPPTGATVARDTTARPPRRQPVAPPDAAAAAGWMPLSATGVDRFATARPTADGRGVLIGILDSGIDAGVPGLRRTSTGERKILDLRDFSGEGAIALAPLDPHGDSVTVGPVTLTGFGRVRVLSHQAPWYGGIVVERTLGGLPAGDLNGDGDDRDSLAVIVARATDGWVVWADTDGDGSLANERPVRDYSVAGETLGWHIPGQPSPMTIAANVSGGLEDAPVLDLVFDNSGHGTHVAGIAAGHDMYDVAGFDGVAPGAQLLGLKIANDAQGGISVTGSMRAALNYAIEFARVRRLPLVLNMSFGVGNEREGTAEIDRVVDSVLAAHPDLVFSISAGNDGPGLSTVGFPGSAERAVTVGASFPLRFLERPAGAARPDPVAFFSARGGELAKPDLIAPGIAYSTVPRWDVGEERALGTSMAAPHVAGLVARLRSALGRDGLVPDAATIKRALMVTAHPVPGATFLDQGTGLVDLPAAYAWLRASLAPPVVSVQAVGAGAPNPGAAYRPSGLTSPADTTQMFVLTAQNTTPARFTLRSNAEWLRAPEAISLSVGSTALALHYDAAALRHPGLYVGVVTGWSEDTVAGPAFRLINTVVIPHPAGQVVTSGPVHLPPGALQRVFFAADSGRPLKVVVATTARNQAVLTSLHEPGGMPYRGENNLPAGPAEDAAVYQLDGRMVRQGIYEIDAVAPPAVDGSALIRVVPAPVQLAARRDPTGVEAEVLNRTDHPLETEVAAGLIGGERTLPITGQGGTVQRIAVTLPAWARRLEVDVAMDPDQWPRFTDFGLTLFDSTGRILERAPLNYAQGRLSLDLPEGGATRPAELRLFPGFADPDGADRWTAQVTLRLYADSALALVAQAGGETGPIPPGGSRRVRYAMAESPWTLGDGFYPLAVLLAITADDTWTREVPLPPPTPAVMR